MKRITPHLQDQEGTSAKNFANSYTAERYYFKRGSVRRGCAQGRLRFLSTTIRLFKCYGVFIHEGQTLCHELLSLSLSLNKALYVEPFLKKKLTQNSGTSS